MKNDSSVVSSPASKRNWKESAKTIAGIPAYIYQLARRMVDFAFVRLPRAFAIPLLLLLCLHVFILFPLAIDNIHDRLFPPTRTDWSQTKENKLNQNAVEENPSLVIEGEEYAADPDWWRVDVWAVIAGKYILFALTTLLILLGGALLFYWLAVAAYGEYRRLQARYVHWRARKIELPSPFAPARGESKAEDKNPLAQYNRIGIILSGSGAKGAYQAGAMKAIYEFLDEHNAHSKVCMIAATSIGSWNALFWLAGLVKQNPKYKADVYKGGISPLEEWWRKVSVKNIVQPVGYIPTRQNHFLSNQPWQENFDELFKGTKAGEELDKLVRASNDSEASPNTKPIHFYFTRSNIEKAHLAFTTNNCELTEKTAELPHTTAAALDDIRDGVFSSMDIPPLVQYMTIKGDYYEDGGVIDNLPVRFGTEVEHCDLLFILPLNASFERKVDHQSVFRRLARVTEIRQGVLERNSFKMIRLYNELASLRKRIEVLQETQHAELPPLPPEQTSGGQTDLKTLSENKMAEHALHRNHEVVHVFSICPAPELKIQTTEFWKTKEAGEAFHFMYQATKNELKGFTRIVNSEELRMILVGPSRDEADSAAMNEAFVKSRTAPVAQPIAAMSAAAATSSASFSSPAAVYRQFNEQQDEYAPDLQLNVGETTKAIRKTAGDVTYNATYFRDF